MVTRALITNNRRREENALTRDSSFHFVYEHVGAHYKNMEEETECNQLRESLCSVRFVALVVVILFIRVFSQVLSPVTMQTDTVTPVPHG